MGRRIFFDGLNLALSQGTGIATYTRMLARLVHEAGDEVGLVYSSPRRPVDNPLLREIDFLEPLEKFRMARWRKQRNDAIDLVRCLGGVAPTPVALTGVVIAERYRDRIPPHRHVYVARNLFATAARYFRWTGRLLELDFAVRPDILHCTYPLPVRARGAQNVCTIHDLIPLRLPYTTLGNKRALFRLLTAVARNADHIVTVSESSRRDIITLLGVSEDRVSNTYEAVEFTAEQCARSDATVAEQIGGLFRLEPDNYLLFYGAIEPKKNVKALLDAYLMSGVDLPLVLVGSGGWDNQAETKLLAEIADHDRALPVERRRIRQLDYVSRSVLVSLIKGARAVLFPSLYEGFGLPVLEAMVLGTPVVTSRVAALPEIAGEAALYVDPYDTDDIVRAIKTIAADRDLRAELSRRGRAQAELFSVARYRERVGALYRKLS